MSLKGYKATIAIRNGNMLSALRYGLESAIEW